MIVNLFQQGDKTDRGNYRGTAYRGIALLSTVGNTSCTALDDRKGHMIGKEEKICQGQARVQANS